jgi:hypothetical protein
VRPHPHRRGAGEPRWVEERMRLDRLAVRLEERGPLAVRESTIRRGGTRLQLELDDGSTLWLRLFYPRRQAVAALIGVRWEEQIGWIVTVRTTSGERRDDYAWLAELDPPAGTQPPSW